MAYSERELLARIIQCEAGGEGDNGMKAVASVTMNRVNVPNGEYSRVSQGGNIINIIFQEQTKMLLLLTHKQKQSQL